MDSMEVQSKGQLVAALKAGMRDTFKEAQQNPFEVKLGTCTYTFKCGLHERRAAELVMNIHRTPAAAFGIAAMVAHKLR